MKDQEWDTFENNLLEMKGRIERTPISCIIKKYLVSQEGMREVVSEGTGTLDSIVHDDELHVRMSEQGLTEYLPKEFSFNEISTYTYCKQWTKDALAKPLPMWEHEPKGMLLFYKDHKLREIVITVPKDKTWIELEVEEY